MSKEEQSHARAYPVRCAHLGCPASHPGGKWGNIRAHSEGWVQAWDGRSWCPRHATEHSRRKP